MLEFVGGISLTICVQNGGLRLSSSFNDLVFFKDKPVFSNHDYLASLSAVGSTIFVLTRQLDHSRSGDDTVGTPVVPTIYDPTAIIPNRK